MTKQEEILVPQPVFSSSENAEDFKRMVEGLVEDEAITSETLDEVKEQLRPIAEAELEKQGKHGGPRPGAGRPHEHQEYLLVEVVDFYGDKDVLPIGAVLNRNGTVSKTIEQEAERVAAHHVEEQAQSVKIVKRLCCSHYPSEVVRIAK